MKNLLNSICAFCFLISQGHSATLTLHWRNVAELMSPAGALLELGYYTQSDSIPPNIFGGDFFVLGTSSIGTGSSTASGFFSTSTILETDTPTSGGTLGSEINGNVLAIRFYDASSREEARFFNAISDTGTEWKLDLTPGEEKKYSLEIRDSSTQESQLGGAFSYTPAIPIPEPSISLLTLLGGALCLIRRR